MKCARCVGPLVGLAMLALGGCPATPDPGSDSPSSVDQTAAAAGDTPSPGVLSQDQPSLIRNGTWWNSQPGHVSIQGSPTGASPAGGFTPGTPTVDTSSAPGTTPSVGTPSASASPGQQPSTSGGDDGRPDSVSAAVDTVVQQFVAAATLYGACASLADVPFDLQPMWADSYGDCPHVALVSGTFAAAAYIDFGQQGCSTPATARDTVRGALDLWYGRGDGVANIDTDPYDPLVWADRGINGSIDALLLWLGDGIQLVGSCDISTVDVGWTRGDVTVDIYRSGVLAFATAAVTVSDGMASYSPTLADVDVNPIAFGNFVPSTGAARLEITTAPPSAGTHALMVTFTSQSPADGTVFVSVDGAAAVAHQVPGVAP
jgi:hypothetical protein